MTEREMEIQRALGTLPQLYPVDARTEDLNTGELFKDHFDIYAMDHDDARVKLNAALNAKYPKYGGQIKSNLVIDEERLRSSRRVYTDE